MTASTSRHKINAPGNLGVFGRLVPAMKPATTITKVCRVLGEFRTRSHIGVTELAHKTDLLPSDVHRILTSLQSYGFVEQNRQNKTYHLGTGLLKLGLAAIQQTKLREVALPLLRKLSEQTEAASYLAIFDRRDLDIFLAGQIHAGEALPFKSKLGMITSAHGTALGKTIMANVDRETVLSVLRKHGMPKCTPHTITRLSDFDKELKKINSRGYGLDLEESASGGCCLAASVRDATGAVAGAISISMPAHRFYSSAESYLASQVKLAAAEISNSVGYGSSRH
ncbi:MAG: IclR family transcriptional regulator [Acidobacteriaceae bacterium]|nr:IclR family transcriptional regulator [Acidobacteriaceae bacterium]MBV9305824.1 IclR family transcriptional regulator [Acidobacteriaceae bacterium]MBV9939384.1 IclR family transcriptional regulator [Acidobacteriaceae bacterium]